MSSSNVSHLGPELPAVDDRLVAPETRYEVRDGALVHVPPADEPHGTRHSKIAALVEIHSAPAFDVACDMLTRTSARDDIAPDVSVFPRARHPLTGRRQLEHLAFEVVSTQSLGDAGAKAASLVERGVRRVFAIDIERARALEWSASLESWSMLDINGFIEDEALAVPLPIQPLVHAAEADDAVARALLIKRNPVIEQARAQDRSEGEQKGFSEAIITVLDARGITVDAAARVRILGERDTTTLVRWVARAATCAEIADVFRDP